MNFFDAIDLIYIRPFPPLGTLLSTLAKKGYIDNQMFGADVFKKLSYDLFFKSNFSIMELVHSGSMKAGDVNNVDDARKTVGCVQFFLIDLYDEVSKLRKLFSSSLDKKARPFVKFFSSIALI